MTEAPATYPRSIRIAYAGLCTLADGKPGCVFFVLAEDGTASARELIFPRKVAAGMTQGGVYEIEQTAENSFRISTRKYIGLFHDAERRAVWRSEARAVEVIEEVKRMEKKDARVNAALDMLDPLRRVYRTALPTRRLAIEVMLLDYLRRR